MLIDINKIHSSWKSFFTNDITNEIKRIEEYIGNNYTPSRDRVFKFTNNNLKKAKVVILGQDPYPQQGAATGRAFEVSGLKSWNSMFRQASLRNLLKLLYKTYYGDLLDYKQIKLEIEEKKFKILPPCDLFKSWELQGVLLLNIYLTCKLNSPKSHRKIWKSFSNQLVRFINNANPNLYWFLWGNEAKNAVKDIKIKNAIISDHPMICSLNKANSFINSKCFEIAKYTINWLGE